MKLFARITPEGKLRKIAAIVYGIIVGIIIFLFYISNAASYLSDNPTTCVNCHVMAPQYATWFHSSHRETATCNDCHVPHDNIFNTYFFKAKDGLRHATIFTMRSEPQVIRIHEAGQKVVKDNCIRCHSNLLYDSKLARVNTTYNDQRKERDCWECHQETPHGKVNSISSVPYARVPLLESPVPEWLKSLTKSNK
jgi:cytochrome c nitrite reductase small subunit